MDTFRISLMPVLSFFFNYLESKLQTVQSSSFNSAKLGLPSSRNSPRCSENSNEHSKSPLRFFFDIMEDNTTAKMKRFLNHCCCCPNPLFPIKPFELYVWFWLLFMTSRQHKSLMGRFVQISFNFVIVSQNHKWKKHPGRGLVDLMKCEPKVRMDPRELHFLIFFLLNTIPRFLKCLFMKFLICKICKTLAPTPQSAQKKALVGEFIVM